MDLNDYQQAARRTAIYPEHHRVIYPALGLASEAGEVAGNIIPSAARATGHPFSLNRSLHSSSTENTIRM